MARRNKKSDTTLGWLALIVAAVVILVKIFLYLLPFVIIAAGIYYYSQWQNKKLNEYNNDWNLFFQSELKNKLKIAAIVIPITFGLAYFGYANYQKKEKQRIENEKALLERQRIEEEQRKLILQEKIDSSNYFLDIAQKAFDKRRYNTALLHLDSALIIYPENYSALFKKGITLKYVRNYSEAIATFDKLNAKTNDYLSESYLEKGRCLLKLNKRNEAITQVYNAVKLNNKDAIKLYDQINPVIKEIVSYTTRCCDGTTSSSSGRGACSHHGGVCRRNDPIYKERRKFEIK